MINSLIETGKNAIWVMIPVVLDVILPLPIDTTVEDINYHELIKLKLMIILLGLAIIGQLVIIYKNLFKRGKLPTTPTPGDLIGN